MSVDADRNREAELASAEAGHVGLPVDAICTGCRRVHVKRAAPEDVGLPADVEPADADADALTSFTHVCHRCGSATWWNPVAVLSGLADLEAERQEG